MPVRAELKKFFSFSFGTYVTAIIALFSTPIISHLFSLEEFGKATTFSMIYTILLLIVQLGLNESFVRFFYEVDDNERNVLFHTCFLPGLLATIIACVLILAFSGQISKFVTSGYDKQVSIILCLTLVSGLVQAYNQRTIRMSQMGVIFSAVQIIQYVSNFISVVLFAFIIGRTYQSIILGQLIANLVASIFGLYFNRDYWIPLAFDRHLFKKVINYGLPFIAYGILWWLFAWIDRLSLRMLSNFAEIGLYSAALKVASVMNLLQTGFFNYWQPIVFEKVSHTPDPIPFFRKASVSVSMISLLAGTFVLMIKDFIFLLFAKDYRTASLVCPFLVFSSAILTIMYTTEIGINIKKKTYWQPITVGLAATINFLGNQFLIPVFGARGAAISTGLSYLFLFILKTAISQKLYNTQLPYSLLSTSIAIFMTLCFALTFVHNYYLSILLSIVTFLALIFTYRDIFKLFLSELFDVVQSFFKRR